MSSKSIYRDDLLEFFLKVEEFGLSLHVRFSEPVNKKIIRHTEQVFDEICISLLDKGFNSLYTTVEDYKQYRFAEHFGFVDQHLIAENPSGTEYQVMKVEL